MLQSFPPTAKDPCSKAAARDRCRCTESYSILIAMLLYAYCYQICIQQCLLYAYLSIVNHFGLGYAFSSISESVHAQKAWRQLEKPMQSTESYSILIAMLLYAYRYQICIQQCLLYAYLSIVDHFGLGYAFSSICKGCACSKSMADVIMLKSMTEKLGGENPTVGISGFEYENPSKLTLLSL